VFTVRGDSVWGCASDARADEEEANVEWGMKNDDLSDVSQLASAAHRPWICLSFCILHSAFCVS
jgi:hypothetical protein